MVKMHKKSKMFPVEHHTKTSPVQLGERLADRICKLFSQDLKDQDLESKTEVKTKT